MKFDVVLGNPPYQMNDCSGLNGASALYDKFMQLGNEISRYQSFIVPMRWATHYSAKGVDKQWVENELQSNKYRVLKYFIDAGRIFNGIRIRGGVMCYLRDNQYRGKCLIEHADTGDKQIRNLALHDYCDMLILDPVASSILSKVWSRNRFSEHVSNTNPFGIETNQEVEPGALKLYCSFNTIKTVDIKEVQRGVDAIGQYGNFILRTFGYGTNSEKFEELSLPILKEPGNVCTGSYLIIYPTDRKEVAMRVNRFLRTKFVAYLVGIRKSTHNCTREAYQFIPMQDFEGIGDIDFDLGIDEIDEQLYRKYKLSQEEIDYIRSKFS